MVVYDTAAYKKKAAGVTSGRFIVREPLLAAPRSVCHSSTSRPRPYSVVPSVSGRGRISLCLTAACAAGAITISRTCPPRRLSRFARVPLGIILQPDRVMRYTAVLLDIDGTIIDSNDAHAQAGVEAFERHGYAVDYPAVRSRIGKGGDKLLAELAGLDSERGKGRDIAEARTSIFKAEFLPTLQATPGARAMLEWLHRAGVTVTVATS